MENHQLENDERSYLTILLRILSSQPDWTPADRRRIYERVQSVQKLSFESRDPPVDDAELNYQYRILRQTIRFLESDIRSGADINAPGYRPVGLDAVLAQMEKSQQDAQARKLVLERRATPQEPTAEERAAALELVGEQQQNINQLMHALAFLDHHQLDESRQPLALPGAIQVVRALLIFQFQLISGDSSIAIIWMLISPAVLLALISSMYFLTGVQHILNMDVPTFALLGAGTWIMCRQVIFRVSTQIGHNRVLVNLPTVAPLKQAVTQALLYLLIYTVSLVSLVGIGYSINMASLPDHLPGVVVYLIGMWLFALALGLLFGAITVYWPYFLRFAPAIERALQLFSGVFFVTEQLPQEYRYLILWCPTAHGLQLMRSYYFNNYDSTDAQPVYFWLCILAFFSFGLLVERAVRHEIQPV